ncbi:MAG: hypothetical protein LLG20_18675 [Acidobacteriales bacterium]|nr:hypothetical protein [Terriglobales bacterium]
MRDPRVDPQAGDVLRKGKRQRKVVGRPDFRGPWVIYRTPTDEKQDAFTAERLPLWQKRATDAEVVSVSGGEVA